MGNELKTAPEEQIGESKCCHYWIIEISKGPTSRGMCKFCGAEREFDSYGPDAWSAWDRDTSTSAELLDTGSPDPALAREEDDS